MVSFNRIRKRALRTALLAKKRAVQNLLPGQESRESKLVVFVSGNQRSGTNMVMDVLEQSLDTDVYHERDPRAFQNYEMKNLDIIHRLVERSSARVVVFKALCEAQDLRRLLGEFAPAKAVWVLRDYQDAVNSMQVSFGNFAKQARRIARDHNSCGWLGRGMSDHTQRLVQELVTEGIDDVSASALQWYYRNVLFFEQGLEKDPRSILLRYEAIVKDPTVEFPRLFEHLGLRFRAVWTRDIFSSSIRKAAPPPIDPGIQSVCQRLNERFHVECP